MNETDPIMNAADDNPDRPVQGPPDPAKVDPGDLVYAMVLRVLTDPETAAGAVPDEYRARRVVWTLAQSGRVLLPDTMAVALPGADDRDVYDKPGMSYTRFGAVRAYSDGRLHVAGYGWASTAAARELALELLAGCEDIRAREHQVPPVGSGQ